MSQREGDAARSMLEGISGEHGVFPDATARVTQIESLRPEVRFTRHHDGRIIGWGVGAEQATGTVGGQPFYYRFRYDTATLSVWPSHLAGEPFDPEDMPAAGVAPKQRARRGDVTGDPFAYALTAATSVDVFIGLLDDLAVPQTARTPPDMLRPHPGEVWPILASVLPGVTLVHLEPGAGLYVTLGARVPSAGTVRVQWGDRLGHDGVRVAVFSPDARPLSRGDSILDGVWPDTRPRGEGCLTAEAVVRCAIKALETLDPNFSYDAFTSRLEPQRRRGRQRSAVQAQREIAAVVGVRPISTATAKAWLAMSTDDDMDLFARSVG